MQSGRLNLFADLADPSKGEGAFVPVLPLSSGEQQVNQCDQRGTYPDGDQEVVGSEVALRIEVDQGFIRSSGHIGRLGQTAESLCETDHIREFFPVTALRGWFGNVPAGQVGDGTGQAMSPRLQSSCWRGSDDERLWLSALVEAMERAAMQRADPGDGRALAALRAQLALPAQPHFASPFSLRN